jgi:hypothetical protein
MSNYPVEFECPITRDIMTDPVVDLEGHTYERSAIEAHLLRNRFSPMTRNPMRPEDLHPNYALKSQIERYHAQQAQVAPVGANIPFLSKPVAVKATTFLKDGMNCVNITLTPPVTGERQPIVMFLALDNSGSMGENASPNTNETGGQAFTRMDLCKHTIRTVAGMLNEKDRLSIVSFSTTSVIVLKPTFMDTDGKSRMERALAAVRPDNQTNIWAGLESMHRMANVPEFANSHVVAALLTDGLPNINPPRGIVPTFQTLKRSYTLSTFGFGYNLDSNLLEALATEGGGTFGFIPDYSMVATVFINWAATVLATAALNTPIQIAHTDGSKTTVRSGVVQFGQAHNILHKFRVPVQSVTVNGETVNSVAGPQSEFQSARNDIMSAIRLTIDSDGRESIFRVIYDHYSATTDTQLKELLRDIKPGGDDEGQVIMAPRFYKKWGKHYLRAYLKAQEAEQCMNFKDHGLQLYGGELFRTTQAEGEAAFASLPALEPSGTEVTRGQPVTANTHGMYGAGTTAPAAPITPMNMAPFYDSRGGCFTGDSLVRMADDSRKPIQSLRRGDTVWTPNGIAAVRALVTCNSKQLTQDICHIGGLGITPYHPIMDHLTGKWIFPCELAETKQVAVQTVYNLVLYKFHIVDVNNVLCVTLAHNFKEPVVSHPFFGTERVLEDLAKCSGWIEGEPVYRNLACRRNTTTGLVDGWFDDV